MAPAIPDRWLNYKPLGDRIAGTRFIAFKVPLRQNIVKTVEIQNRLDDDILLRMVPNLGLIIDLTNTDRFYDPHVFLRAGLNYKKLRVPGHVTPSMSLVHEFKLYVTEFLNNNKNNDKLIGVHCTHGVNRTGYFLCSYMISELKLTPQEAISRFQTARGHRIERDNYINALQSPPQYYKASAVKRTAYRSTKDRNLREYEECHPYKRCDRNWRDGSIIYPNAAKERVRSPEHRNLREYKEHPSCKRYDRRNESHNDPNAAKERVRSPEHRNLRESEDRHPHKSCDRNWRDGSRIYQNAAKERVRTPEHRNLRESEDRHPHKSCDRNWRDESRIYQNAAKERVRTPEHRNLRESEDRHPHKSCDRNWRDGSRMYPNAAKERVRTPDHRNLRESEERTSYKRYDGRDEIQIDTNAAKERVRTPEHQNLGEYKEHQPYKKLDHNERDAGYPVRDANHSPIDYEKANH